MYRWFCLRFEQNWRVFCDGALIRIFTQRFSFSSSNSGKKSQHGHHGQQQQQQRRPVGAKHGHGSAPSSASKKNRASHNGTAAAASHKPRMSRDAFDALFSGGSSVSPQKKSGADVPFAAGVRRSDPGGQVDGHKRHKVKVRGGWRLRCSRVNSSVLIQCIQHRLSM
jgi:hypothetical protein